MSDVWEYVCVAELRVKDFVRFGDHGETIMGISRHRHGYLILTTRNNEVYFRCSKKVWRQVQR